MIRDSSELWESIRRIAAHRGWFAERFEDRFRAGRPDVFIADNRSLGHYGATGRNHAWVELKHGRLHFEPGQLAWALAADATGERTWTMLHKGESTRVEIFDQASLARAAALCYPRPGFAFEGQVPEAMTFCLTHARDRSEDIE